MSDEALRARILRALEIEANPELQRIERELCRRDIFHFFDNWVWTYDPRAASDGRPSHLPFVLFPRQREMVQFVLDRLAEREDGLIEKSRDIGFTWVAGGFAAWAWLFRDGFKTAFGSRKEDMVDKRGDPDCIFEKIRYILRFLPTWLMPPGFIWQQHDNHMRLVNPANSNTISGEAGTEMGRGGRNTMYWVDEAAFLENGDSVDAATAANTEVRIWGSTVNGMGNIFARKRHGGSLLPRQIFRFHWTQDPRKTPEWAAKKQRQIEPHKWASEYDIDYSASVEGVCIPAKWVMAAVELAKLYPTEAPRAGIGGLDVGAGGSGKSVFIARFGPIVLPPISWGNPDTIETAHRGVEEATKIEMVRRDGFPGRVTVLAYDAPGVGQGVQSALKHHRRHGLTTTPVNTGDTPSETEWPDGESSQFKFLNLRAELWWLMRARFKASYELLSLIQGKPDGQPHPISDCILLPSPESGPDAHQLVSQISLPKWYRNEKGKIQIESKKKMAERGIPSPDHADALALTHLPNPDILEVYRKLARWA